MGSLEKSVIMETCTGQDILWKVGRMGIAFRPHAYLHNGPNARTIGQ